MRLDNDSTTCVLQNYTKNDPKLSCPFYNNNSIENNENIQYEESIISTFCKVSNQNDLPPDLQELLPGITEPLPDDYNLPPLPPWMDVEKIKKGQAFALKYMFGLSYADTISLMLLFSSPDGLKPLIYTEKSHTPSLARKRYLSTVLRVKSWYETDLSNPQSEGYKNLKSVRTLHLNVSKRLNRISVDEVHQNSNLEEKLKENDSSMLCPLLSTLKKDFSKNGPSCPMKTLKRDRIYLNQLEMSMTQFGFFGLMLLFPEKFAGKTATNEELENFLYLWKFIGYMLGVKDEYNMCKGTLEEAKQRSRHLLEYFFKPMLLSVNKEWEHMSRCSLQGIEKFTKMRINFEATILYLCWLFDIQMPNLMQYVGWKEHMLFNMTKLILTESHKIPGFGRFANFIVKRNIEKAEKEKKRLENQAAKRNN